MIDYRDIKSGNYVTDEFYNSFGTIHVIDSINEEGINLYRFV